MNFIEHKLFSALVCNSYDWLNSLNMRKCPFKVDFNTLYFINCLSVVSCILCVKIKTFLFEESILPHNKRNCLLHYPDHLFVVKKEHLSSLSSNGHSTQILQLLIFGTKNNIAVHHDCPALE